MEIPIVAVGAIVAAIITGVVSLAGLIISKEQKTSEFRQQWIDGLRSDVAALIGNVEVVVSTARQMKISSDPEERRSLAQAGLASVKEEYREAERLYHQILLRLNPSEHHAIHGDLKALASAMTAEPIPSFKEFTVIEESLIHSTQVELKREWDRVKKGEPAFRAAKYCAVGALALALLVAALPTLRSAANASNAPQVQKKP